MPRSKSESRTKHMAQVLLLHRNGWGNEEIGRYLGVDGGTVDRWLVVETYCELRRSIFDGDGPSQKEFEVKERSARVAVYEQMAKQELPLVLGAAS